MATTNIADKNMNIVEAINEINLIMEKNKEVSNKLEEIVSQVKLVWYYSKYWKYFCKKEGLLNLMSNIE